MDSLIDLYKKLISDKQTDVRSGMEEALAPFEQAIGMFQPGGEYGAGLEKVLARGKEKSTARGMQSLVSSGLSNTTLPAGLDRQYEEEVATPARATLEQSRMSNLAQLYMGKAGMASDWLQRMQDAKEGVSVTRNIAPMPSSMRTGDTSSTTTGGGGMSGGPSAGGGITTGGKSAFPNIFGGASPTGGTGPANVQSEEELKKQAMSNFRKQYGGVASNRAWQKWQENWRQFLPTRTGMGSTPEKVDNTMQKGMLELTTAAKFF